MNELKYYPYSANKFGMFEDCKYKFKLKVIDKVKEKATDQKFFEKGSFIHHALALYPDSSYFKFILSNKKDIDGYVTLLEEVMEDETVKKLLANKKAGKEKTFRISHDWKTIPQNGKKINYRNKDNTLFWGEIDYIGNDEDGLFLIDWKTGKHYPNKSADQLMIYMLWLFLLAPENTEKIRGAYYYLEHGMKDEYTLYRDGLADLKKYFMDKINKIEQETTFAKSPSKGCTYCGYFDICKPFNIDMEKYNGNKMASSGT